MRYKKGSLVEVLMMKELPICSWRSAEIVSGNGHSYSVRYSPGVTDGEIVDRVSRKYIRPCPPTLELAESWKPGDVVEVFHSCYWKMATISKDLGCNRFLVRLFGSVQELEVSKCDIRVRHSWLNDQWIPFGKVSRNYEELQHCEVSTLECSSKDREKKTNANRCLQDHIIAGLGNKNCQEAHILSSRTRKRGSLCCNFQFEDDGAAKKFRVAEKEGRLYRVLSRPPGNVDAIARSKDMLCQKHMDTYVDDRATHLYEISVKRDKQNDDSRCSPAGRTSSCDSDTVASSVGSCSFSNRNLYRSPCQSGLIEDTDSQCSDAESICRTGYQEMINLPPTSKEEIHRRELETYRCTMEALHASGPLSWEEETMLTNLRRSLHISNDEHMMEGQSLRLVPPCF